VLRWLALTPEANGGWCPSRSSKPVSRATPGWRVRFPSASAHFLARASLPGAHAHLTPGVLAPELGRALGRAVLRIKQELLDQDMAQGRGRGARRSLVESAEVFFARHREPRRSVERNKCFHQARAARSHLRGMQKGSKYRSVEHVGDHRHERGFTSVVEREQPRRLKHISGCRP
jgi:hypothetical protein